MLAFDQGRIGYKEAKEDYINKIVEDYLEKNKAKPVFDNHSGITVTSSKNIETDYYSYYAYSNGLTNDLDTNLI